MNSVFASASALLAASYLEKFTDEHLDLVLGRLGKETGVRVDRSSDRLLITGKWSWVLESHDILLEEFRNLAEFTDDHSAEDQPRSDILEEGDIERSMPVSDEQSEQFTASGQYIATNEIVSEYMRMMSDQFRVTGAQKEIGVDNITTMSGTELDIDHCNIKVENVTYTKLDEYDDGDDTDDYMDNVTANTMSKKYSKRKESKSRKLKLKASQDSCDIKVEPYIDEEENFSFGNAMTAGSLIAKASLVSGKILENFQCTECNYVGKNKTSLTAHTKRRHVKKFKCTHCTSSFGFNKDLTKHLKLHVAQGGIDTLNGANDMSKNVLKRGRKKRPKNKDQFEVYQCDKCPYVGKKDLLREHKRRLHSIKFNCDQCDKSFGYNKDLNRHKRNVHCVAEYQCMECKKFFKTQRSLNVHGQVHQENKEAFACQVCDKHYSTKYVLDNHVKSEHMGMKKSFMCPICGKSFTQKTSYRQHANVHAGIRPYVCDVCGKSFSYENALKAHKFIHNEVRQFQCQICDKRFLHKNSLRIHGNVHKESHNHMCTQCGLKFTQKQSLVRHERIHSGAKPYSCTICQKSFRDASIIRRHIIMTHKKDPKKWQEDMLNNTLRSPSFFVAVLGMGNDLPPEVKETDIYADIDKSDQNLERKSTVSKEGDDEKLLALSVNRACLQADSVIAGLQKDSNNLELTDTQNQLTDSATTSLQNDSSNLELTDT